MEKLTRNNNRRFQGQAVKGEIRNPYGRAGKPSLNYRKAKEGLLQVFIKSSAAGTISDMLDMKLPAILRPQNRDKLTVGEDKEARILLLANFKWAVEQFLKILPKEIGIFGKVGHEHTLIGMVKGAVTETKSPKVIEMSKSSEKDILKYKKSPEMYE